MIAGMYSAISGLNAFEKKLNSTANNIANVNTDGYKKTRVTFEDNGSQGVQANLQQIDTPGLMVYEPGHEIDEPVEKSNVDLSNEMVRKTLVTSQLAQTDSEKSGFLFLIRY